MSVLGCPTCCTRGLRLASTARKHVWERTRVDTGVAALVQCWVATHARHIGRQCWAAASVGGISRGRLITQTMLAETSDTRQRYAGVSTWPVRTLR
jgi:hypothetical protein